MQKRLFLGIPLPKSLKKVITNFQETVNERNLPWIKSENLHITVCFLGNIDESNIPLLQKELKEIFGKIQSFEILTKDVKLVPYKKPRMMWIECEESIAFTKLVQTIKTNLKKHAPSLANEHRKVLPHITLLRLKSELKKIKFKKFPPYSVSVNSCQLVASELRPEGAKYTVLDEYAFKVA